MASLLRKKWILNAILDPSTLPSKPFAQITKIHNYLSEAVAAECTVSDSFHCVDALLTPSAMQDFLAANEGYSVPRLLGHLVKLQACELSLTEDRTSCSLIIHSFAPINSDQCFAFGDPVPVLNDPTVQAFRRSRVARRKPHPNRVREESTQDLLLYVAESACQGSVLTEEDCVISASQEAIFEHLLGEGEQLVPSSYAMPAESQGLSIDDLSQDFYASQPPLEWKVLSLEDDADDYCDSSAVQQRERVMKADSALGLLTDQQKADQPGEEHHSIANANAEDESHVELKGVGSSEIDMFPQMDPLEGWWEPSPIDGRFASSARKHNPEQKKKNNHNLSPPPRTQSSELDSPAPFRLTTQRSPIWRSALPTDELSISPFSSQASQSAMAGVRLHEEDLLPLTPHGSPRLPEEASELSSSLARRTDELKRHHAGDMTPDPGPPSSVLEGSDGTKRRKTNAGGLIGADNPNRASLSGKSEWRHQMAPTTSTLATTTTTSTPINVEVTQEASETQPTRKMPSAAFNDCESLRNRVSQGPTGSPARSADTEPTPKQTRHRQSKSRYSSPSRDAIWELLEGYYSLHTS